MSDDTDKALRRLFAEARTEASPEADAFVRRVTAGIARQRRIRRALRVGIGFALTASVVGLSPLIVGGATHIALLPTVLAGPFETALASPLG